MTFVKYFGNKLTHTGNVFVFGDDISVDLIHPAEYFSLDKEKVKKGLFKGIDESLSGRIRQGDIIVAGKNFGCGSSREVYATAMSEHGIAAVVTESAARIFYRNMINFGILVLDRQKEVNRYFVDGDEITLDLKQGLILKGGKVVYRLMDPPNETLLSMLSANSGKKLNDSGYEI